MKTIEKIRSNSKLKILSGVFAFFLFTGLFYLLARMYNSLSRSHIENSSFLIAIVLFITTCYWLIRIIKNLKKVFTSFALFILHFAVILWLIYFTIAFFNVSYFNGCSCQVGELHWTFLWHLEKSI